LYIKKNRTFEARKLYTRTSDVGKFNTLLMGVFVGLKKLLRWGNFDTETSSGNTVLLFFFPTNRGY
jgi:hypothetical protein